MLPDQLPPDKRSNPRFLARIAIFHGPYQKDILTDYTVNMGTGGVFIETRMILQEGTEITVKFSLPNTDRIIVAKAAVAWVNDPAALKNLRSLLAWVYSFSTFLSMISTPFARF